MVVHQRRSDEAELGILHLLRHRARVERRPVLVEELVDQIGAVQRVQALQAFRRVEAALEIAAVLCSSTRIDLVEISISSPIRLAPGRISKVGEATSTHM